MVKRLLAGAMSVFLLLSITGCVAMLAAGAGGGGTAYWLSNKLVQRVESPYERTIEAAESALMAMNLEVKKKTVEKKVAQLKSEYTDGKEIWVDVRRLTDTSSRIEVRVGGVSSDKEAANKILNAIVSRL